MTVHTLEEATPEAINQALEAAAVAFDTYRKLPDVARATFLEAIAEEIVALGEPLIELASQETSLPTARITGERGRTVGQLQLFANLLREGSWVNAIIEPAQPDRLPLPKPDLRQMQMPLGVVAVFGASNFPLAFSVAGGDTVSALAAGCPVVFKGHPAHPGTCAMVSEAILKATERTGMPNGVFALVQGASNAVGEALVSHPITKAVGFTGSFRGGKALFDLANRRPEPIPVYAEMGSTNPVFFLPGVLAAQGDALAGAFADSVVLGVGQFCTNPGVFVVPDQHNAFVEQVAGHLAQKTVGQMLTDGIRQAYLNGIAQQQTQLNVRSLTDWDGQTVRPHLLTTDADTALANPTLLDEVFGPSTVGVVADSKAAMLRFASQLHGHLTATVHGTPDDLIEYADLLDVLQTKVGRVVINGFPTGVEVSAAMVHGGPYPATTDARTTSVGTSAIYRFTRPVCFQNYPQALLPDALKDSNPLGIKREE